MKVLEFAFKYGDKDSGKNILNALLHHAYPKRHALLFAYEYRLVQFIFVVGMF